MVIDHKNAHSETAATPSKVMSEVHSIAGNKESTHYDVNDENSSVKSLNHSKSKQVDTD